MTLGQTNNLERFGFSFEKGGAHIARTMMLKELRMLLAHVNDASADRTDYLDAIEEENCLSKRSGRGRKITARHLVDLYALDPSVTLFRAMRFFWTRDVEAQPLLALLSAYSRDAVLRLSAPFIKDLHNGSVVSREDMESYFESTQPGRFSAATLRSTAQNLNGTWTLSGHLIGKIKKTRVTANATPGAVAYALLLGYLAGSRGASLFQTEYAKLLDCSADRAAELAEDASRRGWIVFKRVGDIQEVLFPNLLAAQEMEWVRDQS